MSGEETNLLLQLLLIVATGGGVYAAVRADLREAMITAASAAKSSDLAHQRINQHISDHFSTKGQ